MEFLKNVNWFDVLVVVLPIVSWLISKARVELKLGVPEGVSKYLEDTDLMAVLGQAAISAEQQKGLTSQEKLRYAVDWAVLEIKRQFDLSIPKDILNLLVEMALQRAKRGGAI